MDSDTIKQTTQEGIQASQRWLAENGHHFLMSYAEFLALPNHASDLPNITKNADWMIDAFSKRGFDMQTWKIPGAPPIVFGERKVEGATRTLCFYAHYDGQPVEPSDWTHPPFEAVLYDEAMEAGGKQIPFPSEGESLLPDWRLYARSSSDDKAPIMAMLGALDAMEEADLGFKANIKLFFDGEEESGSPHIGQYLEEHAAELEDITLWLLCDGAVYPTDDLLFRFGSRGVTGIQLTVYGPYRSLHSGHYGNWAPVPGQMLARLLTSMKAEDGTVLIDGFYDSTERLSPFEEAQIDAAPPIDEQLKAELGLLTTEGEGEVIHRRIVWPSLTVRGLSSGSVGEKVRNVIPSTAIAELGLRLARGNDPEGMLDLVEAHIRKEGWHIVYAEPNLKTRQAHQKIVKIKRDPNGFPASKVSMDQPEIQALIEGLKAFTQGKGVFLPSTGASNRIYGLIFNGLEKPGICVTMVNRDNNQHAAHENVRIGNLTRGVEMMAVLFTLPD
ncbi:MAG: M20/M25/M40 family metallo-hydrolase [Chloroflexota bacterium]